MAKNKEYKTERVATLFRNGQAYKNGALNLETEITRSINFVEGRQWTNASGTEDYPKIVLNYLKQIMKVRQAGILQNDYSFLVNTLRFEDTRKIQYFLKHLYNENRITKKNIKVIADNFKKGTSGLYFYWDNDARSTLSNKAGRLKSEVFDIRQLVVADPEIQDIQEQEWLIYTIREKVGALKYKYPEKEEYIFPDGHNPNAGTQREQTGVDVDDELTSVYIHYYRNKDGQVCYTIHTEYCMLEEETALNPGYKSKDLEEVPNTLSNNDEKEEIKYDERVFGLYPFAVYVMDERDNIFYGVPGAYELIEAQKSINAHFSTYDYALAQNVLGGFVMRKGVLGEQEITTDNAQIIELDVLPNEDIKKAFGRIPVNNVPSDSLNYGNILVSNMRAATGSTNVQTGQADYSNQTARATEMLLARARENSGDYAILFEEYMKDIGQIMFMFSKFYYENEEFNITEHGNTKDTYINETFNGNEYQNEQINFDIQVSPSNSFNESVLQQLAMMSVQTGNLKMLSVLKMLPYNTFPSYQELLGELQKEDTTQAIMQKQEETIKEMQKVMQQMATEYQKSQEMLATMDTVVEENLRLKEDMAKVYASAIKQSQDANTNVLKVQAEIRRLLKMMNKE